MKTLKFLKIPQKKKIVKEYIFLYQKKGIQAKYASITICEKWHISSPTLYNYLHQFANEILKKYDLPTK